MTTLHALSITKNNNIKHYRYQNSLGRQGEGQKHSLTILEERAKENKGASKRDD